MNLSDTELALAELVRDVLKDAPPFVPIVYYHKELDETHIILRDCSCYETARVNGVALLRDNYRNGDVVGMVVEGRLVGVAESSTELNHDGADVSPER